jgi:fructose-specific component phosphotransferase system IIB-like protein
LLILSMIYFEAPARAALGHFYSLLVGNELPISDELDVDLVTDVEPAAAPDANPGQDEEAIDDLAMVVESVELNPGQKTLVGEKTTIIRPRAAMTSPATSVSKSKETKKNGVSQGTEDAHGDHFVGRTAAGKAGLLKRMGGTDASEAAVARGLVWLKNHQFPDGSWNFDHIHGPECNWRFSVPARHIRKASLNP